MWSQASNSWQSLNTILDTSSKLASIQTTDLGIYSLRAKPQSPAPTITEITPMLVEAETGTEITIIGSNFQLTPTIDLGITSLYVRSATPGKVIAVMPSYLSPGAYDMRLRNPDSQVVVFKNGIIIPTHLWLPLLLRDSPTIPPSPTNTPLPNPVTSTPSPTPSSTPQTTLFGLPAGIINAVSSVSVINGCADLYGSVRSDEEFFTLCNSTIALLEPDWLDHLKKVKVVCGLYPDISIKLWENQNYQGNLWSFSCSGGPVFIPAPTSTPAPTDTSTPIPTITPSFSPSPTRTPQQLTALIQADSNDAEIGNINCANWADCHSALTGNFAPAADSPLGSVSADLDQGNYAIKRAFFSFDTTSIPNSAKITNVQLTFRTGTYLVGNTSTHVVSSTALTPYSVASFGQIGYVSGGSTLLQPDTLVHIDFNEYGHTLINRGGITQIALINDFDIRNATPSDRNGILMYMTDADMQDPQISVLYEIP